MKDLSQASGGVNFLPEDYVEQRVQGRWNIICIGLIVIVFIGVVAGVVVQQRVMASEADARDKVNEEYMQAGKQIELVNDLEAKRNEMMTKFQISVSLLEPVLRSKLLEQLTKMLPKGVDLLGVDLKTHILAQAVAPSPVADAQNKMDAPPVVLPPEREVEVSVSGYSVSDNQVAAFITNLQNNPLMKEVNLAFSEECKNKDEVLKRFRIDMKLARNVDLRKLADTMSKGMPAAH